jgi:hypothetical protein
VLSTIAASAQSAVIRRPSVHRLTIRHHPR